MNFAIFDLECTELRSDKGFLLCGGLRTLGGDSIVLGLHEVKRPRDDLLIDRYLAVAIRTELEKYDGWIGWNSKCFDIPYLNGRLLLAGERPIEKRLHIDAMYYSGAGPIRFSSRRLDWTAKALGVPAAKTELVLSEWKRAGFEAIKGFRKGQEFYDKVLAHNLADLEVTEQVYNRVKPLICNIHR